MININRNNDAIDATETDLGIDMDASIKSVSIWQCLYVLKGNCDQSFTPVFMSYFCWLYGERALYKVLWRLDQISRSYKVAKFWIQCMWRHTRECIKHVTPKFLCIFCYFYGENTSYNKVLWCFLTFFTNLWSCSLEPLLLEILGNMCVTIVC